MSIISMKSTMAQPHLKSWCSTQTEQKQMILSLVKIHMDSRLSFDDLIKSKGKGMIFLLHREPGVGKTLTAGIYAPGPQTLVDRYPRKCSRLLQDAIIFPWCWWSGIYALVRRNCFRRRPSSSDNVECNHPHWWGRCIFGATYLPRHCEELARVW